MVSATPSGGWLQCVSGDPRARFLPRVAGADVLAAAGAAGLPRRGKRPRTTLSPSLATRDGVPYLGFGTPGGDQQDQWPLIALLARVHKGLGLQASLDSATFHSDHFPSSFYPRKAYPGRLVVEERLGPDVIGELADRGHDVTVVPDWTGGRCCAVSRDPETGFLSAAADARGMQCYAAGR